MAFLFRKKKDDEKFETAVSQEVKATRAHFDDQNLSVKLFKLGDTLGTGTFGRVRIVTYEGNGKKDYYALKMLKKSEIIRLKQVEHIKAEKSILSKIAHPFIVNLYTSFQNEKVCIG